MGVLSLTLSRLGCGSWAGLGRARLWKPPSPCKDITELWQKHGYEGVRWWVLEALGKYEVGG